MTRRSERPRIGQYRHRPASSAWVGPDGRRHTQHLRRRFPYQGLVLLVYAVLGLAVGWCVSQTAAKWGWSRWFPTRLGDTPLPPSPSLENVLFGAGAPEVALACGLAGWLLWRALWNSGVFGEPEKPGPRLAALLPRALAWGPLTALLTIPIGVFGLYLRTAPPDQPLPVRILLGLLLAAPILTANSLQTVAPLVLLVLGLGGGVFTAGWVAWLGPKFPLEAKRR